MTRHESNPSDAPPLGATPRPGLMAGAVLSLLFLLAAVPLILARDDLGRGAYDQRVYHLPAIRQFAAQLPTPNLRDYPSATTPAFHLVMAAVDRWLSDDPRILQLIASLFTVALLMLLAAATARTAGTTRAIALGLPLASSLYVFSSGVWLLPDNAAWLGLLAVLLLAMREPLDGHTLVAAGLAMLLLVLTRQIHLWAIALFWTAAWLSPANRPRWLAITTLAMLPAIAAVAAFVYAWHGAVPPSLREAHQHLNFAVPAVVLCLIAIVSAAMAGFLVPAWPRIRPAIRWVLLGILVGLILGSAPESSYSFESGRSSGIWNIVRRLPVICNRSPLIVLLSALGGGLSAAWIIALGRHRGTILLVAWAAFSLAHTTGANAWQRYFEPFVLMTLVLAAAWISGRTAPRWALAGPAALALLLAAVTVLSLR
ncbi:MAG: hypothetical protein ACHRHE_11675 [Tepidisphaerales bacterium]